MRFLSSQGKAITLTLRYPKENLSADQVRPVMNLMASKDLFPVPVTVESCSLVDTSSSKIF